MGYAQGELNCLTCIWERKAVGWCEAGTISPAPSPWDPARARRGHRLPDSNAADDRLRTTPAPPRPHGPPASPSTGLGSQTSKRGHATCCRLPARRLPLVGCRDTVGNTRRRMARPTRASTQTPTAAGQSQAWRATDTGPPPRGPGTDRGARVRRSTHLATRLMRA